PEHKKILLYRKIHINNHQNNNNKRKQTCPNHKHKDPNYIGIGDQTLIDSRRKKNIPISPKGTFNDYVSFYFSNRSPMLYNIWKGFSDVTPRLQEEIIYLVSNYEKIKLSKKQYVYFDGHGIHHLSKCYNNDEGLENIDWEVIDSKIWYNPPNDSDRTRRKQAELLVYKEVPLDLLLGIGCYSEDIKNKIVEKLSKNNISFACKVKKDWYY
ncbi:MAG: DUF4433 domain-containing protein, partial [FCB group bacterium]